MDRYSNGSYIVKDKVINTYLETLPIDKEIFTNIEEHIEENPEPQPKKEEKQVAINFDMLNKASLKEIDDRMVIINNFLDDIEGK